MTKFPNFLPYDSRAAIDSNEVQARLEEVEEELSPVADHMEKSKVKGDDESCAESTLI